jgi:DnaJ-class molecular chaperone
MQNTTQQMKKRCKHCEGSGELYNGWPTDPEAATPCDNCDGKGYVMVTEKSVTTPIPALTKADNSSTAWQVAA